MTMHPLNRFQTIFFLFITHQVNTIITFNEPYKTVCCFRILVSLFPFVTNKFSIQHKLLVTYNLQRLQTTTSASIMQPSPTARNQIS